MRDELLGLDQGRQREVLKNGWLEERLATGIPAQVGQFAFYAAIAGEHLRDGYHISGLAKDVAERIHDAFWRALVNPRVDAVDVAGGALRAVHFVTGVERGPVPREC